MSQPQTYNRATSFTNLQVTNPTGQPQGPDLDIEFDRIKTTTDQLIANLALIQRDDGALANASVGRNQLSSQVTIGFSVPTAWATGIGYVSSPASTVFNGGKFYSCLVSHTSGTFATDLAAAKWVLIADLTAIPLVAANQIAVSASGLLTTNVQTSLEALDAGKAATSHTHPASAISDSTAAGRNMLTAANLAAQQTLLGLGAQAYVNNAIVTAVGAQLAFTGVISPTSLAASANDWAPTGWSTSARVRVSSGSAVNITGFQATTDGDIKILENVGSYAITLTHDDTASAAANRLTASANHVLGPGQVCLLMYGATSARWRVVASGMLPASSAQTTALSDASVAVTPATLTAGVRAVYPASSGSKVLATPADGSSGNYTGRALVAADLPVASIARAWAYVSAAGGASGSSNIASAVKNSTGLYTITMSVTMANSVYPILVTANGPSGNLVGTVSGRNSTSFTVYFQNSTNAVASDTDFSVVVFGN